MISEQDLNRYLDGEMSDEETKNFEVALETDKQAENSVNLNREFTRMHLDSFPAEKDSVFIENEFEAISSQINEKNASENKIIRFPLQGLVALGGIAAALLIGFTALPLFNKTAEEPEPITEFSSMVHEIAYVETDIAGASSMIFVDDQSGWTFVWVDEPSAEETESIETGLKVSPNSRKPISLV